MTITAGGLSTTRLRRMREIMASHIERGTMPGLVTLVSRRGEVHVDTIGTMAVDGPPVARDTIFRISSMTKPIIAAATMILVEECRLRLDEPVDRLLPELADRRVLRRLDGPVDDTVPAHRPITVRDLLTFRMGMGIVLAPPGTYPIQDAIRRSRIGVGPPAPDLLPTPDEWVRGLAQLPLLAQPGERWHYNTGSEVLGVLIARAAGQPLETFLTERIFEPLGMHDTGFHVPATKLDRFATGYQADPHTDELAVIDRPDGQWSRPPAFPSGGGGLVSTVDDYLAFGRLMLNNGRYDGGRVLSRPSVSLMTTDHLTPEQKAVSGLYPGQFDHRGWGFGLSVVTGRDDVAATPGQYGWDGGLGTSWSSDPSEDMVLILLTQRAWDSPNPPAYVRDFRTTAYQAIDD
jgi:CubicO group peptidase (beta-lactamase class C family)